MPTTKPRSFYSSAKPRCSLIKYVASRKSARCNKCTRSLPVRRRGRKGDGGCISSGTRALCLFSSNPPRRASSVRLLPPHHAKTAIVAWNSHQHNNPLSLSLSYPRKPLSQRLRWGVSSNNAGNLPPSSLPPSYAACNARPLSRIWPLGVAGTDGVGCILAAAGA